VSMRASWIVSMSCALVACSFNDDRKHCSKDSDCASDQRCYEGFCLRSDSESASDSGTGGKSSSGGNGGKGTSSMNNPNTGAGSKATAGTGGSGAAGRGNAADGGAMQAPATGIPGECSDGEERPCLVDPTSTTASELCNRGTQRCGATVWGSCIGQPEPDIEQCNGLDDDCDKKVDEQTEQDCFPDGESGCTRGADGRWSCEGLCAAGKSTCADGRLSYCGGFIAPTAEACAPANTPAADENCDGMIDEACACTAGETRTCYNGREGTLNVGKCVAGMQTCSNGSLGACMNAVIPSAETCANQGVDDDCDGMTDNIPALGSACLVATNMGACRAGLLQCQAGKAEPTCVATLTPLSESCNNLDDDCNGKIDDTFNLQTDAMNCGACGKACAAGEACCGAACVKTVNDANNCGMCGMKCPAGSTCSASKCMTSGTAGTPAAGAGAGPGPGPGGAPAAGSGAAGGPGMPNGCTPSCTGGAICCAGACVDPATDVKHCGMCGTACTSGEQPGCCNSRCVDMVSNNNCGQCGRDCSLLLSGGLTCSCTKGGDGSIACTGPVLNVCL
jgi:hypothetical protein